MVLPVGFTGKKLNLNDKNFYKEHPDLAPKNVYLSMDRVIKQDEIERTIENFGEPAWKRAKNWFKYLIKGILK